MTRTAGILLPVTALPSAFGIGDFGRSSRAFVDFLNAAGQTYWQILPLGPTHHSYSFSPYGSYSAFALNHLLIDPEDVVARGFAGRQALQALEKKQGAVRYPDVAETKLRFLKKAYAKFVTRRKTQQLRRFVQNNGWVQDYALFTALSEYFQKPWWEWPEAVRRREASALQVWRKKLSEEIHFQCFVQWLAAEQWQAVVDYAHEKNIRIIGDIPMFVIQDSVDVWVHPEEFKLDDQYTMTVVAGVPPDLFNNKGQRWGVPVYDWPTMAETGYRWWVQRLQRSCELFDLVRLDHFRGFAGYYEIPASADDGTVGEWIPGPGKALFAVLQRELGELPFIAEDLGIITPDVTQLLQSVGLPGLRVALIGFMDFPSYGEYSSHNVAHHPENCVAYTTTHDFETFMGWMKDGSGAARDYALRVLGADTTALHWRFLTYVYHSRANLVIAQLQDILGLDNTARMNFPGTEDIKKNWTWRVKPQQLSKKVAADLKKIAVATGRFADNA